MPPAASRAVAAASGAASVRVWEVMSRGWDPWTERPLPEGVRVAYPPDAVHNHFLLGRNRVRAKHAERNRIVTALTWVFLTRCGDHGHTSTWKGGRIASGTPRCWSPKRGPLY